MSDDYDDVIWVCPCCGMDMPNDQTCPNCGDVEELVYDPVEDTPHCGICESALDAMPQNHFASYWCPGCGAYWVSERGQQI